MSGLIVALALSAMIVIAVVVFVSIRPSFREPTRSKRMLSPVVGGEVTVTLPIDDADTDAPATKRLVHDAVIRAFAAEPKAVTVIVRSLSGRELGREERDRTATARPFVDAPIALREHGPRHLASGAHAPSYVRFTEERPEVRRTLAEHLDLPPAVRQEITDPDDPVDVVEAILHAGGLEDVREGNVLRCGDRAVIVMRSRPWDSVDAAHLNSAYIQFVDSHATSGIVVTPGALHAYEVRRREALVPELKHAGMDGIQRMADAVSLGADPLDLAAGF